MSHYFDTSSTDKLDNFRDLINATHPTVCVAGCFFEPADVLERMDPIAFKMLLDAYLAEEAQQ